MFVAFVLILVLLSGVAISTSEYTDSSRRKSNLALQLGTYAEETPMYQTNGGRPEEWAFFYAQKLPMGAGPPSDIGILFDPPRELRKFILKTVHTVYVTCCRVVDESRSVVGSRKPRFKVDVKNLREQTLWILYRDPEKGRRIIVNNVTLTFNGIERLPLELQSHRPGHGRLRFELSEASLQPKFSDRFKQQQQQQSDFTESQRPFSYINYRVTVEREARIHDLICEVSFCVLAWIINFSLGCLTGIDYIKEVWEAKKPAIVVIVMQALIMPPLGLGLAKALGLSNAACIGMLTTCCISGGGFAYIIVAVIEAEDRLSMVLHFINSALPVVTVPFWLGTLGRAVPMVDALPEHSPYVPVYMALVWVLVMFLASVVGVALQKFFPTVAEAILIWFVKPLLLLSLILFVTLGVYINMYIFTNIEYNLVAACILLPCIGLLGGFGLTKALKLDEDVCKTVAIDMASFAGLTTFVTLRWSLPQPEADLASAIPMWVIFTAFVPFALAKILMKLKNKVVGWCMAQKEKTWQQGLADGIKEIAMVSAVPISNSGDASANSPGGSHGQRSDKQVDV